MDIVAWLLPMIMSAVGTAVSTGTSLKTSKDNLEFQRKVQADNIAQQQRTAQFNAEQSRAQQQALNQQTVNQFKQSMNIAGSSNATSTGLTGIGVQGLNGQTGYLNEEEQTNYQCGGRRKRVFGGKNKVDSASIYVSPNNIPVKSDSNNVVNYRDRLAQFRLGGRKC